MRRSLPAIVGIVAMAGVAPAACTEDPASTVKRSIGPDGGLLSSHDEVLTIYFPPGAVEFDALVTIAPSDTPPPAFSRAYRVQPDADVLLGVEVTMRGDLPSDPRRAAIGGIRRQDFQEGQGRWIALPRIELDEAHGVITAVDGELSLFYAVLDEGDDVSSGTTTTGVDPTDSSATSATDDGTDSATEGETEIGPLSHAADIQPIWEARCITGCHEPGGLEEGLLLGGDAYDDIVDRPSLVATVDLVEPGSPETSYLMHKLDGTHALEENLGGCGCNGSGTLMPQAAPGPLDIAVRDRIRTWIEQGAPL